MAVMLLFFIGRMSATQGSANADSCVSTTGFNYRAHGRVTSGRPADTCSAWLMFFESCSHVSSDMVLVFYRTNVRGTSGRIAN